MKLQNPSFKIFLNEGTHGRTHGRTDKPKAICSPLFQCWGHNKIIVFVIFRAITKHAPSYLNLVQILSLVTDKFSS